MSEPFQQIAIERAELASFTTAVVAWCQHPTASDGCFLTRRTRRLADLISVPAAFEQLAYWLNQHQDQEGDQTR